MIETRSETAPGSGEFMTVISFGRPVQPSWPAGVLVDTPRRVGRLALPTAPVELPDGLALRDGVIMFECRACHEWTELPVDPEEFDVDAPENVCGRSPRCCP